MAQQHGHLLTLPTELQLHIVEQLESFRDIGSVVRLNRHFRALFFDYLFDLKFTRRLQSTGWKAQETIKQTAQDGAQQINNAANPRNSLEFRLSGSLFQYAVRIDSPWIVEYIATRRKELNLMEPLPRRICEKAGYTMETGYLHFALVSDAPRVAAYLLKYGVDMSQEIGDHPELMPLCLVLSMKSTRIQQELDACLRIACSYVLPRTAKSLLARGADPNAYSPYGLNAMHWLLAARLPGLSSDLIYRLKFGFRSWESGIPTILYDLLAYGADIHSPTKTSLSHECHSACWKSISCTQRGETAFHLVAASKFPEILALLVINGADPEALNEDGYTPLYGALRQEHKEAIDMILKLSANENPIVYAPRGSTALHIACRFAYARVVDRLLGAGASANVVDFQGYTPLHEALKQTKLGREKDVLDTLRSLSSYGADPDIPTRAPTPRELAKSHHLPVVRHMFDIGPRERPARLHTPQSVGSADQPIKIQANRTPKSRVFKNPKSLANVSINSTATKEAPGRTPIGNQVHRAPIAAPIETKRDREKETDPPIAPRWARIGSRTLRESGSPPLPEGNKQFGEGMGRPSIARESFPALVEDTGPSVASGRYDSAAASFWGSLPRPGTAPHTNDEPKRKTPTKRGRARWKPFAL
ncbi:hypothetical protein ANO14919_092840 [Xylariales sp. No.14919]|nr:hypothetical protein ANO14919_092840 [Xylariales sp. No.14919]